MKLSNTQTAILCLIIANIIWGAAAPISKWTLQEIEPFTFAFIRFFLSALILLPFTYKHLRIHREDVYTLVFLSVIGLAFRMAYNFYGLKFAPSINELIIASTAPVFLLIGAIALFHEKARKKLLFGMALSFFGVVTIIIPPVMSEGANLSLMGNIFFLVAMSLSVVYILLLKELAPKYRVTSLLFWTFSIATLTVLPFAAFEMARTDLIAALNSKVIFGVIFAVVFATIIAHLLNVYGVKYIKASEVGMFSYVDPFIGIAIAQPLLGEQITVHYLFGAALVFTGIFIAENRIHYHPFHLLKPKPAEEKLPVRIP